MNKFKIGKILFTFTFFVQILVVASFGHANKLSNYGEYVGDLVGIPGGSFVMGSDKDDWYDEEMPAHKVTIKPFKMMEAEVTFDQWDLCVSDGGCTHNPSD
ncbi:MAG: SUMF1/EgtB/PvdO family nonheme iron enzyme, partial [Saccharospirillaceae bacterium]|nr:formylglycine-generating enzyme family protein [Pseudomonadales bacterium]NRB81755.1 SUMF1/EgtB/PvdO family nonheme iron enzyme [Saccharospirillaceae bacterium]